MTKRPGLSALSGHLTSKPEAVQAKGIMGAPENPAGSQEGADSQRKYGSQRAGAQADGRKGVLLRLKPEAWIQLKALAAQQTLDRKQLFSMQSALEEALNDWFKKNGMPPIA